MESEDVQNSIQRSDIQKQKQTNDSTEPMDPIAIQIEHDSGHKAFSKSNED